MSSAERLLLAVVVIFSATAAVASVLLWVGLAFVLTERTPIPCNCILRYDRPPVEQRR